MKLNFLKKLAPAALALGLAGSGALLGSTPAFASTRSHVATHAVTKAKAKKPVIRAGTACTKAELAKTTVAGKSKLIYEKVGKGFKWEVVKPAAKPVAKKAAKPAAKKAAKPAAKKAAKK
jgi:hypothetical protein